jgi:hypothetical protein
VTRKKTEPAAEPLTGAKGLAKAVDEGRDPNADLDNIRNAKTETRSQMAFTLAVSGASWTTVAKIAGYSSAYRARQAVERMLASAADSPLDRERMRVLTERRLNRLLNSVMAKAVDPDDPEHLPYNARALALTDRIARLYGVDAPTQVQITPTDERIHALVTRMMQIGGIQADAEEGEIMDEGERMEGEQHDNG